MIKICHPSKTLLLHHLLPLLQFLRHTKNKKRKMIPNEVPQPNFVSEQILDWLEDSVTYFPTYLDDPYQLVSAEIEGSQWWDQAHDLIHADTNTLPNIPDIVVATNSVISDHSSPFDSSNKRKSSDEIPTPKPPQLNEHKVKKPIEPPTKRGKKGTGKNNGNNCNNRNSKEGRWAEQLLNPCALAITSGNLTRVQHLLYVLPELASLSGDPNHRLAAHGLRALKRHLSSSSASSASKCSASSSVGPVATFASTEPGIFIKSLMKFNELSPWFECPNSIANSSILQLLADEPNLSCTTLHILDIGVSHGLQWPLLFDALSNRPGGPPSLVRLTVIAASSTSDQSSETPFSIGPPLDNVSARLLLCAKQNNINLQINRLNNQPLQTLSSQVIEASSDETLIICLQFRLHSLNHNNEERTEFLKVLRSMEPKGVILNDNNMGCSCNSCGDFATGFSRQVDYLWSFLDSTSSAFKGRESPERRMMEGEAAKALANRSEMNEGKEKWCERMKELGFVREAFGEDAIDGGRTLLRKYDSNWEMRVDEEDGCVGLWFRGMRVSFCSLWKTGYQSKL